MPGASYFHQLAGSAGANKKRLYIALYPSGVVNNEERKYHWAFLIGPKKEHNATPGVRYHVKNQSANSWTYEEVDLPDVRTTNTLLVRIAIAKIQDEQRLRAILRNLPVINGDPNWRCRTWVGQALMAIAEDGQCVGSSQLDWATVEAFARQYAAQKTAEGRYTRSEDLLKPKPTYDLLDQREIVP